MAMPYENAFQAQVNSVPKAIGPLQALPERLHKVSERLSVANDRLAGLLARINGPSPESAGVPVRDVPAPSGVVHVATFEAERIAQDVERLHDLLDRLEAL